jgi:hypothetical protein
MLLLTDGIEFSREGPENSGYNGGGGKHMQETRLQITRPPPGWLPDDELTQEWQRAVEEYRRECDEADRRRILGESAEEKAAS